MNQTVIRIDSSPNLDVCVLDFACKDLVDADSPYSVLDLDATSGIDHRGASRDVQRIIVENSYTKILNSPGIK